MSFNSNAPRYSSGYGRGRPQDRDLQSGRSSYPSRYPVAAPAPVEEVKEPVDPKSRDLIGFKDHYYSVDMVRTQAALPSTPQIEFDVAELHDSFMTLAVPSRDLPADALEVEPIWNKFEGKYVCILGLKKAIAQFNSGGKLAGKLLSNPTLKRALVQ